MNKGVFITGTSTDVGKTYVSSLIVKNLRENNVNCGYFKGALSGAYLEDNELIPGDAKEVCIRSNLNYNPKDLVSYIFKEPVSPHLAAKINNEFIESNKIKADFDKISKNYDFMVVEGCGGIICPLRFDDKKIMLTDIIKLLNLPIIIVADGGLGTINDTVLTAEYAKSQGFSIIGIILNNYDENNMIHIDNKKMIEDLTNIPVIVCVKEGDENINTSLKEVI
ncbi:dethiobiotin synthase [Terrisporobacter glycolicus]|uniref:ATP-dependent dethiobiotin synthetase BioD n=1 Tax=Terrisporobacter glycolicus ATCC 14880 = DSM 1288 TaxID=1121315 RepID=A0ABZ2EVE4_9FIRM|nr:dethiobiotin synthase [Terrisporobacter glycolicus]